MFTKSTLCQYVDNELYVTLYLTTRILAKKKKKKKKKPDCCAARAENIEAEVIFIYL